MDTLFTSKNTFLFGAGKSDPSLGYETLNICSLSVRLDVVSQDVPVLMGWTTGFPPSNVNAQKSSENVA